MLLHNKIILLAVCFVVFVFLPSDASAGLLPAPTGDCPNNQPCTFPEAGVCIEQSLGKGPCPADGQCPGGYSCKFDYCVPNGAIECNYTLNDVLGGFASYANRLLGFLGTFALLMFVIGGIVYLTSAGNPQRVETGTNILKGTVVGIIIVLGAWLIVWTTMSILGVKDEFRTGLAEKGTVKSQCEIRYGSQKYKCQDVINACGLPSRIYCTAENQCYTGLCPGGDNNVCCKPMARCGPVNRYCYFRPTGCDLNETIYPDIDPDHGYPCCCLDVVP